MADLFDLQAKISLDSSSFDKGLSSAGGKLQSIAGKIGGGLATAAKAGAAAIGAATTAVVAFAKDAVGVGMGFDSSMSQVAATMGTTVDQIQELRDFALEMGSSTSFSASEAADALNYMALAGYDAETSMEMLPNVLNLAAAGGIDLASASDMVTDASSALGLSIEETSELVDKMAQTSSKSNTSVAQLGEAILTIGATARGVAGGTTELSAVLGVLADNGIKGAEGGTHLRNAILSLQTPTKDGTEALAKLGMTYADMYDSAGNMRALPEIFMQMQSKMEGMTQASKDAIVSGIFNKADLASINALIGTTGERWDELTGYIDNATGAAQQMADTQLNNLAGDITRFKSALEGAKITVSDQLTPALRNFVQFGTNGISKIADAFKKGGMSGAMEAFGEVLSDALNQIVAALPGAIEAGTKLLSAVGEGLQQNLPLLLEAAKTVITMFVDYLIESLPEVLNFGFELISAIGGAIVQQIPSLVNAAIQLVHMIGQYISENIPSLIDTAKNLLIMFIGYLVTELPNVIKFCVELISTIGGAILDEVPTLLNSAVYIIQMLGEYLVESLPEMVPQIVQIIMQLVTTLTDPANLESLINVALELIVALAEGLIRALPELVRAAPTIIKNLVQALIAEVPQLLATALELIIQLGVGLIEAIPELLVAAAEIIVGIVGGIKDGIKDIIEVGGDIVRGLWEGIKGAWQWLVDSVSGLFNGFIGGTKKLLGIASPSKVFAEIGENMGLGIGEGFSEAMESVSKDMLRTLNATVDDLKDSGIDWEQYGELAWMSNGGIEGLYDEMRYNFEEIQTSAEDLADYLHSEYELSMSDANKAVETLYNKTAENVANLLEEEERISTTTRSSTQTSGNGYRGLFGVDNAGGTVTNTVTINVYPSEGMDENEIADLVERKLMTALDRREAAWA